MNVSQQRRLATQLLTMIQSGASTTGTEATRIPAFHYCSETQAAAERRNIFSLAPVCAGLAGSLRIPGDYVLTTLNGKSVILLRDASGQIKAYLNACRHRGAPLLTEEKGRVRHLVCPYHHWCYNTGGDLISTGKSDCFSTLSPAESSLVSLPVAERGGFLWLAENGEGLGDAFLPPGIMTELTEFGFEDYHLFSCTTMKRPINWKLAVDTFLESWHFGVLHKNTISSAFYSGAGALVTSEGYGLRLIYPRRSITRLASAPDESLLRHVIIIWLIFPFTLIIWQKDHLESWFIAPGQTAEQCYAEFRLYTKKPAVEKTRPLWQSNLDLQMRTVDEEDFALMAQIQRNLSSGTARDISFGLNESALAAFHHHIMMMTGEQASGAE